MTERYDRSAAMHYAAFRPPLHQLILERVIRPKESFQVGLDIGCGTGYSTVALARYCDRVLGLDSSRFMLDAALRHPKISYLEGSGDALAQLPAPKFDAITFAGSLFYAKTDKLRIELTRVCSPGGMILAYDFEVLLNEIAKALGVNCSVVASAYDYGANLSDWAEFAVERHGRERLQLEVTEQEMAHLLLADSNHFDAFSKRYAHSDPFQSLVQDLGRRSSKIQLQSNIYFTRYRVLEK